MFLGVPRIWEKLHSAITIKMLETGPLRRKLYQQALAACTPLAEKPRSQWTLTERLGYAWHYWLVLRALQNFIGLRQAKVALTGAAPIAPDVVRFFRSIGVPLIEVYGLTESTGMVTGHRLDDVIVGTVGPVIDGRAVPHCQPGRQRQRRIPNSRRHGVCRLLQNPEATAQTIQDGWLHTGDVVREVGGQIKIVDRLKDIMITAGGKNLTPSEIENTMKASPYIKECIVVADGRKYVAALVQIDMEPSANGPRRGGWRSPTFAPWWKCPRCANWCRTKSPPATPSWPRCRTSASSTCSPRSWTTTMAKSPPP